MLRIKPPRGHKGRTRVLSRREARGGSCLKTLFEQTGPQHPFVRILKVCVVVLTRRKVTVIKYYIILAAKSLGKVGNYKEICYSVRGCKPSKRRVSFPFIM